MPDDVVVEHAPAKLNLALHVGAARTDGYHPVRTLMVELEGLHDTVTVRRSGARRVDCAGADGPTNLAWSALDALEARTGVALPLHVIIDKRIPSPAGLGGGSSDAAAVLRWAGYTDVAGAARLGADVSFCLVGGRARVRGIGEVVEPLPFQAQDITLVVPPLAVSTPAAYRAWDELGGPTADGPNDLEPAALVVEPRLAEWRDRIAEAAGQRPVLAGSGATWFLPGHHAIADALPDAMVALTRTDRPQ